LPTGQCCGRTLLLASGFSILQFRSIEDRQIIMPHSISSLSAMFLDLSPSSYADGFWYDSYETLIFLWTYYIG
jgi:hypothetical protein